jgi:hypothetical protein
MATNLRDILLAHPGQSYNMRDGTFGGVQQSQPYNQSTAPTSGPGSAIYANQQARGMINADGSTDAGNQYAAWQAQGAPSTVNGQVVDSRGGAMDPGAWDSTFQGIAAQGGNTYTPGSTPLIDPNSPWANNQGGSMNPYWNQQAGAQQGRDNRNAPGGSTMPGMGVGGGDSIGDAGFGNGLGTSLGALAGGKMGSIPGSQPNYPLDVGAYANPMMGYMLKNGFDTINNGAAAGGSLQSGDTMKQLMQYGMGVSGDAWNKAAGIAQQQQGFGYGVDKNDRDFAYGAANNDRDFAYRAQTGDRDFNFQRAMGQAGLGLQGSALDSANARAQAQLLATLGITGAQAASAGAQGQGNTASDAVQRAIATYLTSQRLGG